MKNNNTIHVGDIYDYTYLGNRTRWQVTARAFVCEMGECEYCENVEWGIIEKNGELVGIMVVEITDGGNRLSYPQIVRCDSIIFTDGVKIKSGKDSEA